MSASSVKAVFGLMGGLFRAYFLLLRRRPAVVISVGGYAAAPASFSAVLLRIPLVIAESNAVPGAVNRIAGRFAAKSAVAWPGTKLRNAVVTGNPVREAVAGVDRSEDGRRRAKKELGVDSDKPLVAVVTGSLGAKRVNEAAAQLPMKWHGDIQASLLHVVGRRDWQDPSLRAESTGALQATAVEYQEQMELLYAAADVMVCRSGATTVAELAAAGVPSILVPLPNSPGDHQGANARALGDAGAAVVIANPDLTSELLAKTLSDLLSNPQRLSQMGETARSMGKPDAAHAVVELVKDVLAQKGRTHER